ncbi:MAG TPA: class A beta-lactamase [Paludibaculum sp.]|jgi:beta-lactamase class A
MIRLLSLLFLACAVSAQDGSRLGAELQRIEEASGGVLGMAAMDLDAGVAVGWRSKERFPMMSVYKFPIAIRALALMEGGALPFRKWFKLEPSDYTPGYSPLRDHYPDGVVRTAGQLLELMVRDSDNVVCDFLLRQVGGPKAVNLLMQRLTQGGIRVDRSEEQMNADFDRMGAAAFVEDGRDSATPEAMTRLLVMTERRLLLQPKTTETLVRWMTETQTGPNRIKALLPPGVRVWHKTGTGGTKDGVCLGTNDVGVMLPPGGAGRIAITVFVKLSTKDRAAQERAIAETALAVYRYYRDTSSK